MQRFEFQLETVLRWRESQAGAEEAKLRALFTEKERIQAEIAQLEDTEAAERASVARADASSAERDGLPQFLHWAAAERRRLIAEDRAIEARTAEQRTRLIEARRAHELLARLKAKQKAEWQKALDREIDALAAEAFLAKWKRSI